MPLTLINQSEYSAMLLQQRGQVASSPCSCCEKDPAPFNTCVTVLFFSGKAVHSGACANCIWSFKRWKCSHRVSASGWEGSMNDVVIMKTSLAFIMDQGSLICLLMIATHLMGMLMIHLLRTLALTGLIRQLIDVDIYEWKKANWAEFAAQDRADNFPQ